MPERNEVIRALIVEDYLLVRIGLRGILGKFADIEVVAEANDGELAVSLCRQQCPNVVLMDIYLPGLNGIEATRQIRAICPRTQVIALSSFAAPENVQQMLQAGAISYLTKGVDPDELVAAIHQAFQGAPMLGAEASQALIQLTSGSAPPVFTPLSPRELDVLTLLVEGLSNPEIAARLRVQRSTIKNHIGNIFSKLRANSRTQAVALAVEHGLVEKKK